MSNLSKDELVREIIKIINLDGEQYTDGECLELVGVALESEGYQVYPHSFATNVECPVCHAKQHDYCLTINSQEWTEGNLFHADRVALVEELNTKFQQYLATPIS